MPTERVGWRSGLQYLVKNWKSLTLGIIPIVFFGLLFFWPVAHIISLGIRGHWVAEVATRKTWDLLWFTVWQAGLSTLIAVLISMPTAFLLYQRRFWGRRFFRTIVSIPFVLPSIVVAIGFSSIRQSALFAGNLGKSEVSLIILANIFMNFGIASRIIGINWANLDHSLDDAAQLDGANQWRVFWSISLPQLRPAIAAAGSIIFLYCATNFGIALVLGGGQIKTIETEIYFSATQSLDLPRASGLVVIQSLLTIITLALTFKISHRNFHFFAFGLPARERQISRKDLVIQFLSFPIIGILILAPQIGILSHAFSSESMWTLNNFRKLAGFGARNVLNISVLHAAGNTFRNALLVLLISMAIGLLISYIAIKFPTQSLLRRTFEALIQLPVGISTVVLGLGYLTTFSNGIFPLRGSWLVTPMAQSIIALPLVVRILLPALASISHEIIESAETDRASSGDIWWLVQVPMVRSAIYLAAGYALIISIGDFAAANFLSYGDQATLPTILFQLISRPGSQNYGMAMAASAIFIGLTGAIVFIAERQTEPFHRRQVHRSKSRF